MGFLPARALGAAACLALLSGCVPSASSPSAVPSGVVAGKPSFYPREAGLTWTYLKEGEDASQPKYTLTVHGPTVYNGETLIESAFTGLGSNYLYYRDYESGVHLHAKVTPRIVEIRYNPPVEEYPPQADLKVGAKWSGHSTVTVSGAQVQTLELNYSYVVLDRQQFKVGDAVYDTFLINLQQSLSTGESSVQSIRFTPNVGEVRTAEGLVLVSKSF
ncbi:MAG TPA: hypothetical protein VHN99_02490 [Deinococcales bacterium]|nr:hypothetical protein [Deinococcales bacterium]